MRLLAVAPTVNNATVQCVECSSVGKVHTFYADLDGEAFKSYICTPCVLAKHNDKIDAKYVTTHNPER